MLDEHKVETEESTESKESCCFFSCFRNLLEGSHLPAAFKELRAKLLSNSKEKIKAINDNFL